jgi:hypothetical protein
MSRLQFIGQGEPPAFPHCGMDLDEVALTTPAASETATTLSASSNPTVSGEAVTFTATVISGDVHTVPAGAVQFALDGTPAGAPVGLDSSGRATLTTGSLTTGTHGLTAAYQPSAGTAFDPSVSAQPLTQTVNKAASSVALAVAPDPTVAGQDATFVARAKALAPSTGVPTGSIQFTEEDGSPIDDPQPLNAAGEATLVASAFAGRYRVKARYTGDDHFTPSEGEVGQEVRKADTSTGIVSDTNPVSAGGVVTFIVTVTTRAPGDVTPSGEVVLTANGEPISEPIEPEPTGPRSAEIAVTFDAPSEPRTDSIGAEYLGDDDTNPSRDTLQQTVAAPPSAAPSAPPSTTFSSARVRLAATVTDVVQVLKGQGIAALKHLRARFTAPTTGRFDLRVYTTRAKRGAHGAVAKRVLIAVGRGAVKPGRASTLRIKLNRAGRRALRRARRTAKPLKLAIVARFLPQSGAATAVVKRVSVLPRGSARGHTARTGWRRAR